MITLKDINTLFPNIKDMEQETWHPTKAYKVSIDKNTPDCSELDGYSELDLYVYRENDKDSNGEIGICLDDGKEQVAWCWTDIDDLSKNESIDFLEHCSVIDETDYTF